MARSFWAWFFGEEFGGFRRRPNKKTAGKSSSPLGLEMLEGRDLPSVAYPTLVPVLSSSGAHTFITTANPTGTNPTQVRHAYGFDNITFNNGTVVGDGANTTIAIVDAFDDPTILYDLQHFDAAFSLPDPIFKKVNQSGGTTAPAPDAGWATEIALDVEWAHAMAPGASILLVEASSASFANLLTAVRYAATQPGVVAVSMSWGGGEFSGETSSDSSFKTPTGHAGVTFLAASGDSGAPISYPPASPNVVSVGGTTLNMDSAGNIISEKGWSGSGGGISVLESKPSYQNGLTALNATNKRGNPDVAYDSDPNTGFPVYDSYNNGTVTPWGQWGGTSDAAPQWAALIAIADEGRALAGLGSLDGAIQTLPKLYALPATDFHDIISGNSTGSPTEISGTGYDLVTGRGSPYADRVVADLIGPTTPSATHFSVSAPAGATAGTSFTVTVTALDASNATFAGYTGTVHFTSTDTAAGLPADYTFTSADKGVHSFTVTLKTASSKQVTVTDKSVGSITGSATVSVTPNVASKLAFVQQPTSALTGAAISPAVTVQVLDAYGNLETADNTDQVTLVLNNAAGATLTGTNPVTVQAGIATFSNLSINLAGAGYTLSAGSGTLAGTTSNSFNISVPSATHFSVTSGSTATAGNSFTITVTALDANGNVVPSYTGTIHFTSTDTAAGLPGDYTFSGTDQGTANFTVTLKTATSDQITATDKNTASIKGSATVSVSPNIATQLVFGQQPTNAVVGANIAPAVTVRLLDAYGNLETGDNTDQVTLLLNNAGGAVLSGTNPVTVNGGIATFSNLSVSQVGTGYTLGASSGTLTGPNSTGFNIAAAPSSQVIEDFENTETWNVTGFGNPTAVLAPWAAHDGSYGLDDYSGNDWIYRTDAAAQLKAGDTASVWLQFAGAADGRAYFGFGASSTGTLSLVPSPNTGQLILQLNSNFGFVNMAAVNQTYLPNHWYRLEVDWGTSGTIIGKVFDSDGTTLLKSVTAKTTFITHGGIAFRATGSDKYWDTVTAAHAVNNFSQQAPSTPPAGVNNGSSSALTAATKHFWQSVVAWETENGIPQWWRKSFQSYLAGLLAHGKTPRLSALDQYFAKWWLHEMG